MILNEIFFLVPLILFGDSAGSNSFGSKRSKQSKSKQKSFFSPTDLIMRTKNKSPTNQEKKFIIVQSIQWCDVMWVHTVWKINETGKKCGKCPVFYLDVNDALSSISNIYFVFICYFRWCDLCVCVCWLKNQTELDKKNSLRKF